MMSKKIRLKKGEVFKEIEGYKDRYYISNKGRLWSNISGRFIGAKDKKTGYIAIFLYNEEGERERTSIHREVGKAFVPNNDPENKTEINHKNYKRDDNRAENLEWVTRQENIDYSYERISNSSRERLYKLWEDEDFRKRQAERIKKRNEDQDFQAKRLEGVKKKWEDEDFRKRKAEDLKKLWEDEDYRKRKAEATKKLNKDPNFQAKRLEGLRRSLYKPLLQYTEEGELVSRFSSQKEAVEKTGIRQSYISKALTGRTKTAGGFKWEYDQ